MKPILIIEDSEQNLYLTRFILEQHGYSVLAALDGPSGIDSALRHRPALILLDIQLPGMDGYQVAARLRSHPELAATPIVAVTSYAMPGDREQVLAAGCTGYLEKPINPATFVADIESFLAPPNPDSPGVHVLVADDLEANRELLRTLFSGHGWRVSCAGNGSEALGLARREIPNLVVSDILMPGMDGFALCREWQRDPDLASVPFVFLTATYTDEKDQRLGLDLGAAAFLTKPLEPEPLMDSLRRVLAMPPAAAGSSGSSPSPPGDERTLLRQYNAALVRKLEDKMLQFEALNRDLERRVEQRTLELEAANLQLQAFGNLGTWISSTDPDGTLVWSPQTCRIFGIPPADFDGRLASFFDRVHPDDRESVRLASQDVRSGRRRLNLQHRIRRPDGGIRWVHQEGELTHGAPGQSPRVVGIVRDITDYRLLEEQLRQSQKMEAIGQLAGGVAHDFNNLLTVISGNTSLVARLPHLPAGAADSLREIATAAERASNLTRQLLAFSRRQSPNLRPLDLSETVARMSRLLRTLVGEKLGFRQSLAPDLPRVLADTTMVEQVVMNLVVNARDALPQGGELSLSTFRIDLDPAAAERLGTPATGPHVGLAVRDNGSGIEPCHLPHIFEPFFTTKTADRGTGLGLAVVYGIVKQHGGHITVDSQPGVGTSFTIYLPAILAPPTDSPTPPPAAATSAAPDPETPNPPPA